MAILDLNPGRSGRCSHRQQASFRRRDPDPSTGTTQRIRFSSKTKNDVLRIYRPSIGVRDREEPIRPLFCSPVCSREFDFLANGINSKFKELKIIIFFKKVFYCILKKRYVTFYVLLILFYFPKKPNLISEDLFLKRYNKQKHFFLLFVEF